MTNQQPSSYLLRMRALYNSNLWRGRFILAFIIIIVLLGMVRLALPQSIILGSTSWLKKHGIESSIESINIDILNGTVSLLNAKGSKGGEALFNVGLIDIHWHWAPLSDKTIVVTKVALDQFTVNIEQYTDKIIIGGVTLPLGDAADQSSTEENTNTSVKPWAASLGEVVFTELNICYLQHSATYQESSIDSRYLDYCIDLDEMTWGGTISYATDTELLKTDDLPLSSTGDFALNGITVTDNKLDKKLLVSTSNALKNVVISGLNNIHIDALNMSGLSALQRKDDSHKDALRFHQLTINDIDLLNLDSLSINDVAVTEPGLYLVKSDDQHWEHQQWIPLTPGAEQAAKNLDNSSSETTAATFKVSINNIHVEGMDSCYLQKDTSLYYCLVFDQLDWQGAIQYDTSAASPDDINLLVTGDLKLSQPNIRNLSIDRSLLNFSSLELSKLTLSGLNSITLEAITLDNFAAMQRSKETTDNTASFDSLTVKAIKYTNNNIAINAIELHGLTNTVSKNTNGEWEHDKWMINNQPDASTTDSQKDKVSDQSKPAFIIALDKLNISSDKNILFIDNSTQPATKVGLQKLTFDIGSLDSTKPDSNSSFKLYAKTSRHSTIDIKGTAKPFADKVSFAADGNLKGFDLRAASPATKKAIGHIIQSGQLDAELDIKAVEGVLDSSIALSLYQFKIKPVSKADADKLDKRFGMPLNQTLVLLRDKDDSIHLDIPITGDVNNPDFDPMNAIIKATSKAATVTLITFYTPYGLIYAGGNLAFNLATALNFDPIEFDPGSSDIQTNGKGQLDKLSTLLIKKPQVHLTLCGITNQLDVLTLYPDSKTEKPIDSSKASNTAITLTSEQTTRLAELASERQTNSKNYLIDKHSIDHNRLILCEPEHKEGDEAVSGVEVNI